MPLTQTPSMWRLTPIFSTLGHDVRSTKRAPEWCNRFVRPDAETRSSQSQLGWLSVIGVFAVPPSTSLWDLVTRADNNQNHRDVPESDPGHEPETTDWEIAHDL